MASGLMTYAFLNALPAEAMVTGRWVERMDHIIDSENGVLLTPDEDHPKCAITLQNEEMMLKLWRGHINELSGWYFPGSRNLTFVQNWQITKYSRICLWEDLKKEGATSLPTGHINSDSIENLHFQARAVHLRPHEASSFSTALINTLTSTSKGKNWRDDNALNLVNLESLMKYAEGQPQVTNNDIFDPLPSISPAEEELEEELVVEEEIFLDGEEDVQEEQIPSVLTTGDFISRVQQKLSLSAGSKVASPVVQEFLTKTPCADCKNLLLTEAQFPLHLPQMMMSAPNLQNPVNLQPSQ